MSRRRLSGRFCAVLIQLAGPTLEAARILRGFLGRRVFRKRTNRFVHNSPPLRRRTYGALPHEPSTNRTQAVRIEHKSSQSSRNLGLVSDAKSLIRSPSSWWPRIKIPHLHSPFRLNFRRADRKWPGIRSGFNLRNRSRRSLKFPGLICLQNHRPDTGNHCWPLDVHSKQIRFAMILPAIRTRINQHFHWSIALDA